MMRIPPSSIKILWQGFSMMFIAGKEDLFFEKCLFVCDNKDIPVGTCFAWKAYDRITTIHWFKVIKEYEGLGIGRALLSIVMQSIPKEEYPVFLHTQPAKFSGNKIIL
ncbi:MAG: GNAT family N-acetyltransferase [Caldicoprobacterales bacterium]